MTHAMCIAISRLLNRLACGERGQTLCARMARRYGHDCLFCRFIGWLVRDADHCWAALLADITKK